VTGQQFPAPSSPEPVYYVIEGGVHRSFGTLAPRNEVTDGALDGQLRTGLATRGFKEADDSHQPTISVIYQWGSHCLPDLNHQGLDNGLLIKNVLERAALRVEKDLPTVCVRR